MSRTWTRIATVAVYLVVIALVGVVTYFAVNPPADTTQLAPADQVADDNGSRATIPAGDDDGFLGTGIHVTD